APSAVFIGNLLQEPLLVLRLPIRLGQLAKIRKCESIVFERAHDRREAQLEAMLPQPEQSGVGSSRESRTSVNAHHTRADRRRRQRLRQGQRMPVTQRSAQQRQDQQDREPPRSFVKATVKATPLPRPPHEATTQPQPPNKLTCLPPMANLETHHQTPSP